METHLLDSMLSSYAKQKTPVTIVLQNRSRVAGLVKAFDSYVILVQGQRSEIVYRHAVSSIFPTPAVAEVRAPEPRPVQAKQPVKAAKTMTPPADRKKKERPAAKPAPSGEAGLNTSMKEGLLRWMQEQKAK